ncbi:MULTISPECIES: GNAT family N-acetyltransferase [Lysinibacillus]|uniref:GNAT family N-acetyltransferase n=1 Tax=Lysinibacillus sp. FJAT-14222 TaxID=1932366 RepID=UPI0006AF66FA|nr:MULTISPECIES: GNAT family N-acetyltransferase [Lysinibacillus]KOS64749.1 acetyltransferase [Lysinibacillus sp. FJAT-14222]
MQLFIRGMNEMYAIDILNWKYEAPYDFYNNKFCDESLKELLDNPYYSIVNDQEELVGFFCTGTSAQVPKGHDYGAYIDGCIDVGIGMKPELTGRGYGLEFFSFILNHLQQKNTSSLRLTVATFNTRAIHLYEKLGFEKVMNITASTEFITMKKG